MDGRNNAWRSRAPGPHAHGNAARQVVDGLRTEVCGQQKQSNDPRNNQHNPKTRTTGRTPNRSEVPDEKVLGCEKWCRHE